MTLKYIIYIATNTSIGYKLYDIIWHYMTL